MNKYNAKEHKWACTNVCEAAGIFGHDGTPWCHTPGFMIYGAYSVKVPTETGGEKDTQCNEATSLMNILQKGKRNGGQDCGVRLNNHKYMCVNMMDFKDVKYAVLTCKKYDEKATNDRGKGGAVIALTKKTIIIGKYDTSVDQSMGGK